MPFPLFFLRLLTFGRRSEILALDYLRKQGYRIVSSGYRMKGGEVDIIAWEGDVLVFVEVKARQNPEPPEDAVGRQKQRRLIRAAERYIALRRLHETPYRFDIVAVTALPRSQPQFRLIRDAFNGLVGGA
jgi:putative endonuclease